MTQEREAYLIELQRKRIEPILTYISNEDGTVNLENLASVLTNLREALEHFEDWRRG